MKVEKGVKSKKHFEWQKELVNNLTMKGEGSKTAHTVFPDKVS